MNNALSMYHARLKAGIIGVLVSEGAVDLSDGELERCLRHCAAGWIVDSAKQYRDTRELTFAEVERMRSDTAEWDRVRLFFAIPRNAWRANRGRKHPDLRAATGDRA